MNPIFSVSNANPIFESAVLPEGPGRDRPTGFLDDASAVS